MDTRDFEPVQFRAAVFTPGLGQLQAARVLGGLLSQLAQFSGDPIVLPIPPEAPPEIPRLILKAPADALELHIAVSRADLFINPRPGQSLNAADEFQNAAQLLGIVLGVLDTRPGRLAAIGAYFARCDRPADILAQHFTKPEWASGPLGDLNALELHANRRLELLEGLSVNSWIRFKTGEVTEAGRSSPAVILERDVNTLPEELEQRKFDPDEVAGFMRQAGEFLGQEIEEFFPLEAT